MPPPQTSEHITAEIEERLGFVPSFFEPARNTPEVLEALWRQTVASYLDNPLPAIFKERLFAYLSRLRSCSYGVVAHSCELKALGASGREVFELLDPPLGDGPSSVAHLLGSGVAPARWPATGSYEESRIIALAAHAFLRDKLADHCLAELPRLIGDADFARLLVLLAHIDSYHGWVRAHPHISYEHDKPVLLHRDELVREEPRLREILHGHGHTATNIRRARLAATEDPVDDTTGEAYRQTVDNATRVLAEFGTVDDTLHAVLRVIGEGMGWAVGSAWLPTRRHGLPQLRCAAFWHEPALDGASFETASRRLRLDPGAGLPGRVWESGQAHWVADVTAEPHAPLADEARRDGLHTCYLLPARGPEGVVAVVEFLSHEIRPLHPILLETHNRVTRQIGAYLAGKGAATPLAAA
jgi:hypothetical protein